MTNPKISEAAKAKAHELIVAEPDDPSTYYSRTFLAFERYIQTTSDVAKECCERIDGSIGAKMPCWLFVQQCLQSLILPEPKDLVEEGIHKIYQAHGVEARMGAQLMVNEITLRGGKITFD